MQQEASVKKSNKTGIVALILLIVIILGAVGLYFLYKTEKTLADSYNKQISNNNTNATTSTDTSTKSWTTEFYERLVSIYSGTSTNSKTKNTNTGSKNNASSNGTSATDNKSNNTGTGNLDTDVPWREEGEADLDYSYQEVRACGALIKEPPAISDDPEQFDQEYHEYLDWIDQDCRDAYAEAGKPYPF